MKKIFIFTISILIIFSSVLVFSQDSKIGTNDFKLGMQKQAVISAVKMKYDSKSLKTNSDNTVDLYLDRVKAKMYFDLKDVLYKIMVEIDSDSDGAKIKKKLLTQEFGEPVVISEEFDDVRKLFLYSKWILNSGKYDIKLYESSNCRVKTPNPCVIVVTYLDTQLEKEMRAEMDKNKRDEKLNKEKEKYDF